MKSTDESLLKRGLLPEGDEKHFLNITDDELLQLLTSRMAQERSLAARLMGLGGQKCFISPLIAALRVEKKLYSKLEICNALAQFGESSIKPIIDLLGKIGKNQHRFVAKKPFKKDNYPLPRDIAARILIRIGILTLPALFDILKNGNIEQVSEAIDAIGFIQFYEPQSEVFELLVRCFGAYENNELIRWKLIRAMSGFVEARVFLLELRIDEFNPIIRQEIDRSLRLGGARNAV